MLGKKFVQNSCEIGQFFCESYSEKSHETCRFFRDLSEALKKVAA